MVASSTMPTKKMSTEAVTKFRSRNSAISMNGAGAVAL